MPRRILEGQVVSDKMDKTVTVLVTRRYMHPVYKKYLKKSDKFAAHDEKNQFKTGDKVQIIECRPISKKKRWTVLTESSAAPVTRRARPAPEAESATAKPVAKKAPTKKEAAPKAAAKKPAKGKKG
jgi:small subunit ribosomal protein S17